MIPRFSQAADPSLRGATLHRNPRLCFPMTMLFHSQKQKSREQSPATEVCTDIH
jgi:hypothetical protein